jgi:gliding motility-associated-like protein
LITSSISNYGNISCYGFSDGFAEATVGGGTPPYSYSWSNGQINPMAINLTAGPYNLTITDSLGCSTNTSVTLTEPQQLGSSISYNDVSCFGSCDGNSTVSVSGGTLPYSYLWIPGLQTTPTATGLCAGQYNTTITDGNNCITTNSVIISSPQQLSLIESVTPSTCGQDNGAACVNVIGGINPFVITWNNSNTTVGACINGVYSGVYTATVSDANGCFATLNVIINDITGPTIDSVVVNDVSCAGDSNGTATVYGTSSGTINYYVWEYNNNTIDSLNQTIVNLEGGVYQVSLIDNNGCTTSASATVNEPPSMASAIISYTDVSCNSICNGTGTVFAGGGTPPYSYSWLPSGETSASASSLCAGNNDVTITDNNGCTTQNQVAISEPDPQVINDSIIDVSCNGGYDGIIYLTVSGGNGIPSYNWSPAGTGNSGIVTNLSSGFYGVTVTDFMGCVTNQSFFVNEPTALGTVMIEVESTCSDTNGVAYVIASGGTIPYSYIWSDAQTNSTANGLIAGTYTITITDMNGCYLVDTATINDIPGPQITGITIEDIDCFGNSSGRATVSVSGGTTPYSYLWNDSLAQTTATANNLYPDVITVVVTDSNGCTTTSLSIISQPDSLYVLTFGEVTICIGDSTEIYATGSGGTPPYTYNWTSGFIGAGPVTTGPLTTSTTYPVFIIDDNGCTSPMDSITISVTPPLVPTGVGTTICDGEDAVIYAVASGGNGGPFTFTWSNNYIGSLQTLSGLTNDTSFFVTVSDGCSPDTTITVNIFVNPTPNVDFTFEGAGCEPTVLIAYFSSNNTVPIVDWLWDFGDNTISHDPDSTTHVYTTAGVYDVMLAVTSDMGCVFAVIKPGVITAFPLPTAGFDFYQGGGILDPAITSLISPNIDFLNTSLGNIYSIFWDFGDTISGSANYSNLINPTHTYSDTGTYIVTLTVVTPEGCIDVITDTLTITGEYLLFTPNAFTPNGDGDNEYFFPKGVGIEGDNFELLIFNRWGDLVAKTEGVFSNVNDMSGWDGRANNGSEIAQQDVYVWVIKTVDFNGTSHQYIGHVTLLK